jgi:putative RecB family exonuclease
MAGALSVLWPTLPRVDDSQVAVATPETAAVAARPREWSLSPSRAADFMTCPLLYRFRVIDRLPEAPSAPAARGTLVHAVLERLFDAPALARSPDAAARLIEPEWDRLVAAEPELEAVFGDEAERSVWLTQAGAMLDRYFTLEDPTRLEPAHRELHVQAVLASGLRLRGYIDRLDVSPAGDVRIVDYKTGTAPREEFEARALFQMKFYALVLWRSEGTLPRMLQLMYLGNGEIVRYAPDEADLLATERKIEALWRAIQKARDAADWRPRRGRLCAWCAHQQFCPEFGGTPPPLPVAVPGDLADPGGLGDLGGPGGLGDLGGPDASGAGAELPDAAGGAPLAHLADFVDL